jgi:hypothetical protein
VGWRAAWAAAALFAAIALLIATAYTATSGYLLC